MERQTIAGLLYDHVQDRGDAVFLRESDRDWTYGEVWNEVERVAGGLSHLGIERGDHVALLLDNGSRFLVTWFALSRLGAVEVPVNTAFAGEPLAHVLGHSDSVAIISEAGYLPRISEVPPAVRQGLRQIIAVGSGPDREGSGTVAWEELEGTAPDVAVGPRDTAAIMFTSGTTGRSKGAVLSHRYFLMMAAANVANMRLSPEDTYYTCLPLFHGMAQLSGTAAPLLAGARIALVPRFSVSAFWEDCRRFGVTGFGAIAAMTTMLHNQARTPEDRDHKVRFAFSVAVPATIQRSFEERFGVRLIDGYGITEGGQISYSPYDAPRVGSCGKPVSHYQVELHDEQGAPVPTGEIGEIVVRPRTAGVTMDGYYADPEATLTAFRDLWLHTGDVGRFDEDGYLYFVDRRKDVIRRRGENISSFEVEALVARHPGILEAAAYPVASELGEDEVMVAVVLDPTAAPTWADIIKHCREVLPRYAVPRYLRRLEELPRTPTEKVEKFRLRTEGVTEDTWEAPDQRRASR